MLIVSSLIAAWLGMQAVHELGHLIAVLLSGGNFVRVVLHPLTISRTDVFPNPQPLIVVWAGPLVGVIAPVTGWLIAEWRKWPAAFCLRFFAGFCLVANGVYIGIGSFSQIGDCREMLQHGAALWQLWLFGLVAVPSGFAMWNGQGKHFGLGRDAKPIPTRLAYAMCAIALLLATIGFFTDR